MHLRQWNAMILFFFHNNYCSCCCLLLWGRLSLKCILFEELISASFSISRFRILCGSALKTMNKYFDDVDDDGEQMQFIVRSFSSLLFQFSTCSVHSFDALVYQFVHGIH